MTRIPTIFHRHWNVDRHVYNMRKTDCLWVFRGHGIATRKLDGVSCMIKDGHFYKKQAVSFDKQLPERFILIRDNHWSRTSIGWVSVAPEDKWHREAFDPTLPDGTYELIGPKIGPNPESVSTHSLVRHGYGLAGPLDDVPRHFNGLKEWLNGRDIEGVVWHHMDGRMAKISQKDFGFKRKKKSIPWVPPSAQTPRVESEC